MRFRRTAASGLLTGPQVWLVVMLASMSIATAADSIGFDGRRYFQKFEDLNIPTDHIAEYVLPRETVDTWTSLVTFHAFPRSPPNAVQAATSLGNTLRSRDSGVEFNLVTNPATSEALIDFLIAAPNSDVVEFNVFKYAPVGNTGLIAAQFARRFRAGSLTLDQLREMRRRAVAEMSRFDMAAVKTYFAQVR